MAHEQHIHLLIEYAQGQPLLEPIHAVEIGKGRFRLCFSPGFVQGVAAGDEIRLVGDNGEFEVTHRAGNLAVQLFSLDPVAPFRADLAERVAKLGGTLDGVIERGVAFTIPVTVGFAAVEKVFKDWVAEHAGWEWYYGNVYDQVDGITPLGWWTKNLK